MGAPVFDLIAHPEAIQPPWSFLAIFSGVGIVLLGLAALSWRFHWKLWHRWDLTLFALAWCGITAYASWTEISFARTALEAAQDKSFLTVEGCLSSFHPGEPYSSNTIVADEVWTLGGERFEYGAGAPGFAWHLVEPLGGAMHADTRANVAFVRNEVYRRNEILRLIVEQHACHHAPDPGPP